MGDFASRGQTVPCAWCGRPLPQERRWFPRRYCGRWHKVKHRVTEIVGDVLGGGA